MKLLNKTFLFTATMIAVSTFFIQDANAIRSGVGSSVTSSSKGGSFLVVAAHLLGLVDPRCLQIKMI